MNYVSFLRLRNELPQFGALWEQRNSNKFDHIMDNYTFNIFDECAFCCFVIIFFLLNALSIVCDR